MSVIRVVLADDDPLVLTGLSMLLAAAPDIEVVARAGDGEACVAAVREHCPDVALVDVRMPVRDGIWAAGEIRALDGPTQVLMLTTFDADEYALRALAAGATGFLLKDATPDALVAAVRDVAAGRPAMSPSVAQRVIEAAVSGRGQALDRAQRAEEKLSLLSPREREVADALASGRSNADIAGDLFMSVPTVKTYVTRILAKVGLESRLQVAMLVRDAQEGR